MKRKKKRNGKGKLHKSCSVYSVVENDPNTQSIYLLLQICVNFCSILNFYFHDFNFIPHILFSVIIVSVKLKQFMEVNQFVQSKRKEFAFDFKSFCMSFLT